MRAGSWLSALTIGILLLALEVKAQPPPFDSVLEEVQKQIQQRLGKPPQPSTVVSRLNQMVASLLEAGRDEEALHYAEPTLDYAEKTLGPEHPQTLTCLSNLALIYQSQGRYADAESLYVRSLAGHDKVLGPDDHGTLTTLENLSSLYRFEGRYSEAGLLLERAVAASDKMLGPEQSDTLLRVNNLGQVYQEQGRYGEAEPLLRRAFNGFEKTVGAEHLYTLLALNNLALLYQNEGRYSEAESLYKRALAGFEKTVGAEHLYTLLALNNLALLYQNEGRYSEAESLYKRALAGFEKTVGADHPNALTNLHNLASLYTAQGRYGDAETLERRVLAATEKVLGPEHPTTVLALNNAAEILFRSGGYKEVEVLLKQAFAISDKTVGPEHPNTSLSLHNLGQLYETQGRYEEAEAVFKRVLASREKVLGPNHPNVLASLYGLAGLYLDQGRYGEAEALFKRSIAAREKVLGQEHPDTLSSLVSLAEVYVRQGRYGEAEPLFERALSAFERTLGPDHPATLVCINDLAWLYELQERDQEAEPLYRRALVRSERALGYNHPDTVTTVNNLAELLRKRGRYSEAEPLSKRAVASLEKSVGPEHPSTLLSINNLALLYDSQGRYGEAETLYERALAGFERTVGLEHPYALANQLNLIVYLIEQDRIDAAVQALRSLEPRLFVRASAQLHSTSQERVRRMFLLQQSNFQSLVLTLALEHPRPEAQRFAADVLLRWKLVQGEDEFAIARLLRTTSDLKAQALGRDITTLRTEFSYLANRPKADHAVMLGKQQALEAKEAELGQLSIVFGRHLDARNARTDEVRAYLPAGAALLDIREFTPVTDFRTGAFGEAHWAALLLTPVMNENPLVFDLGPVAQSRHLWEQLKQRDDAQIAADLYCTLFGKVDEAIKGYDLLYIAPDGFLNLLPFARLKLPDGRYWIQRQALREIQTGRHLIPAVADPGQAPVKGLLALGDIDYSGQGKLQSKFGETTWEGNRALRDELGSFDILYNSGPEIDGVAQYYWDNYNSRVHLWKKSEASEERLKALTEPPRVLHLATHGFYLSNARADGMRAERPMVLSGLALAGANQGLQGHLNSAGEDGILYALEVQGLNLEGTELVVLSACDAGRGALDYSEGVYGLVRAFRTAGARNVLMTLQSINDRFAKEFMLRFYKYWFAQTLSDPSKALRETQLSFINERDSQFSNPMLWASFALVERP